MKAKTVWKDLYETPRYTDYWMYKDLIVLASSCDARWLNCFGKVSGVMRLDGVGSKIIGDEDE